MDIAVCGAQARFSRGGAELLADNLANGYDPHERFPVYHLVLPEGMTAAVPHTPRAGEAAE